MKRLRLDGRLLGAPTRMVGVTPCFSGPLEKGLFFTGSGGAVTLGLSLTHALPGLLGWPRGRRVTARKGRAWG